MLDPENDDIVEAPPHGHASPKSVKGFPPALTEFFGYLRDAEVEVSEVCLGQGLTSFVRSTARFLTKAGYKKLHIYPSAITHASKVAAVGVEKACGIRVDANGVITEVYD